MKKILEFSTFAKLNHKEHKKHKGMNLIFVFSVLSVVKKCGENDEIGKFVINLDLFLSDAKLKECQP